MAPPRFCLAITQIAVIDNDLLRVVTIGCREAFDHKGSQHKGSVFYGTEGKAYTHRVEMTWYNVPDAK